MPETLAAMPGSIKVGHGDIEAGLRYSGPIEARPRCPCLDPRLPSPSPSRSGPRLLCLCPGLLCSRPSPSMLGLDSGVEDRGLVSMDLDIGAKVPSPTLMNLSSVREQGIGSQVLGSGPNLD